MREIGDTAGEMGHALEEREGERERGKERERERDHVRIPMTYHTPNYGYLLEDTIDTR